MDSIIREKSYRYAVRIVTLYKHLSSTKGEYVLSKQLLRSGTSIGAMVREAQNAESTLDFIHKLAIAQKECDESAYWIELMHETDFLTTQEYESIHNDTLALLKIIRSIILTTKKKLSK